MQPPAIDVLGLGAVAVDDFIYLDGFPAPDTKVRVHRTMRQRGGLTGTALVAASRLGSRCAYAGCLGEDELSRFIIDGFAEAGIDTSHLVRRSGARPFHSTILVDARTGSRTILSDAHGVVGADPGSPPRDVIAHARVLFVDHAGLPGMIRAAHIAREAGVPVVADVERGESGDLMALVGLVDHLVVPLEFAFSATGAADPSGAVEGLWSPERDTVVVTAGERGCWYRSRDPGDAVVHQPAFPVRVVDTTGCGDVFHGAYAAALAQGMDAPRRILRAAAAAALKATEPGGQSGIPSRDTVDRFLALRGETNAGA